MPEQVSQISKFARAAPALVAAWAWTMATPCTAETHSYSRRLHFVSAHQDVSRKPQPRVITGTLGVTLATCSFAAIIDIFRSKRRARHDKHHRHPA